ncbi:DUF998 domain-containing protein [Nonomuraea insulae]|uniref:DUF998 domain-containing protein n=1 Tax=Nonomuraea insulae TaxID=1616787 RepID=A0ABW1CND7_9ACTN
MSSRTLPVLLSGGIAAGVLVPVLLWADGATRPGYSLWHHGASQLGTGERGWLQTINFVLGGLARHRLRLRRRHRLPPGHPRHLATGPRGPARTPVPARRVLLDRGLGRAPAPPPRRRPPHERPFSGGARHRRSPMTAVAPVARGHLASRRRPHAPGHGGGRRGRYTSALGPG